MKRYRIVGGPSPSSVKILDPDGKELPLVKSVGIYITPDNLIHAKLEVLAELDLMAEGELVDTTCVGDDVQSFRKSNG